MSARSPILGIAAGAGVATLVGQVVWTGHRRLPSQTPPPPAIQYFRGRSGAVRPSLRIVALGDSTLTGPGLERCDQVWLPVALSMIEAERSIEYVSLAVGGSRVADARARVRDALRLAPDVVVVAAGANDALHGVPVARIRRGLDELIGALLAQVGVVAIANVGDLGNIARVPAPLSSVVRARAGQVRRAIEGVVSTHERAVLLDVTPADAAFRSRAVYTPDLFHPGPEGHAAWARAVLPRLHVAVERAAGQRPSVTAGDAGTLAVSPG